MTTLTLQTIRMPVKNFTAVRKTAFIFVQTNLIASEQSYRQLLEEIDNECVADNLSEHEKQ